MSDSVRVGGSANLSCGVLVSESLNERAESLVWQTSVNEDLVLHTHTHTHTHTYTHTQ